MAFCDLPDSDGDSADWPSDEFDSDKEDAALDEGNAAFTRQTSLTSRVPPPPPVKTKDLNAKLKQAWQELCNKPRPSRSQRSSSPPKRVADDGRDDSDETYEQCNEKPCPPTSQRVCEKRHTPSVASAPVRPLPPIPPSDDTSSILRARNCKRPSLPSIPAPSPNGSSNDGEIYDMPDIPSKLPPPATPVVPPELPPYTYDEDTESDDGYEKEFSVAKIREETRLSTTATAVNQRNFGQRQKPSSPASIWGADKKTKEAVKYESDNFTNSPEMAEQAVISPKEQMRYKAPGFAVSLGDLIQSKKNLNPKNHRSFNDGTDARPTKPSTKNVHPTKLLQSSASEVCVTRKPIKHPAVKHAKSAHESNGSTVSETPSEDAARTAERVNKHSIPPPLSKRLLSDTAYNEVKTPKPVTQSPDDVFFNPRVNRVRRDTLPILTTSVLNSQNTAKNSPVSPGARADLQSPVKALAPETKAPMATSQVVNSATLKTASVPTSRPWTTHDSVPSSSRVNRPLPPVNDVIEKEGLYSFPWFFGDINRTDAESMLHCVGQDGTFLIRKSQSGDSTTPFSISLLFNNHVYNLQLRKRSDQKFAIGTPKKDEAAFATLPELVAHYQRNALQLVRDAKRNFAAGEVLLKTSPPPLSKK